MSVIIETSIGDITVDLYTDERPRCCMNFLKLCKIKYYNFSLFHTVQQNLVAQTGDPTATGRGGNSIYSKLYGDQARFFDMEVSPRIKHTKKGLISMVNNGSDMHGSQFFLTLADNLDYLDGKHTVFGEVAEGFDVLDKLNNTFCGEDNRPHQDIRIYHTVLLDDPYDDPQGLVIPDRSPGPTEEMLNSDHIPCDADIDADKDKTEEEIAEMEAEKEAKANTQILEMVGDLPDAEVAPPDNVLFVCKLNPVTTSEDLDIIFSRFGPIVSCEVIKDSKTGESLQYAFIEFEKPDHCENAYFKMDNVLIDDRRIHVDFSQSVSKLKWKGKGKGVEIMSTGDAPTYVLKNQERKNDGYDLVYDHDDQEGRREDKNNRKKQTSHRTNSDDEKRKMLKDKERNRSRSPVRKDRYDRNRHGNGYARRDDRRREDSGGHKERDRRKDYEEDRRQRRREEDIQRGSRDGERDRRDRSSERRRMNRSPSSEEERGRKAVDTRRRGRSPERAREERREETVKHKKQSKQYDRDEDSDDGGRRNRSRKDSTDAKSDNSDADKSTKKKKKKKKSKSKHHNDSSEYDDDDHGREGDRKKDKSEKKASKKSKKHKSKNRRDSSDSDG